jgi:type II secretory pathway pseudopilin PulG
MAALTVTGSDKSRQAGFTLLGLLFIVAGLGVAMAALGVMWHTAAQREKEQELLFAGNQYRQAIESFWSLAPGGAQRLPKNLDELLSDPRFPYAVRHLRRIYRDPMTGGTQWGLVKESGGGIYGVYSLAEGRPFKRVGFAPAYEHFLEAGTYGDWVFRFDFEKAQKDASKGETTSAKGQQAAAGAPQQPAAVQEKLP